MIQTFSSHCHVSFGSLSVQRAFVGVGSKPARNLVKAQVQVGLEPAPSL